MKLVSLAQTVAPTSEPVSLADAKEHLRIIGTSSDNDITAYLAAARDYVEGYTNRQLVTATYTAKLDGFPPNGCRLYLPKPPLASVTSLAYIDSEGVTQTVSTSDYEVVRGQVGGYLVPASGTSWPTDAMMLDGGEIVTIVYVAGYGVSSAVPPTINAAIRLIVGDLFENRESASIASVKEHRTADKLLNLYRVTPVA